MVDLPRSTIRKAPPVNAPPLSLRAPRRSHRLPRRSLLAGLGLLLSLAIAAPVAAEGSFTSSFSGWLPGLDSRTWKDGNRDASSTRITLGGCRAEANPTVVVTYRLQLTRETPWYLPDENKGRKDFACHRTSVTNSWGRQAAGSYHFTLTHVNGTEYSDPGKVRASTVKVSY